MSGLTDGQSRGVMPALRVQSRCCESVNFGKRLICLLGNYSMNKFLDLTDSYSGKLHVIEYAGKNESGECMWKCECECGNTTVVR